MKTLIEHFAANEYDAELQKTIQEYIVAQARGAKRILVVDEGRQSAGVGEGVITALAEGGLAAVPMQRVVGVDTYTPLAGAAFLVIPGEEDIVAAADALAG